MKRNKKRSKITICWNCPLLTNYEFENDCNLGYDIFNGTFRKLGINNVIINGKKSYYHTWLNNCKFISIKYRDGGNNKVFMPERKIII